MFRGGSRVVTRSAIAVLLFGFGLAAHSVAAFAAASAVAVAPANPKAQKAFAKALAWQKSGYRAIAMDEFRKANNQDGGKCAVCLQKAYSLARESGAFDDAIAILDAWLPLVNSDAARATLEFNRGTMLVRLGLREKSDKAFTESCTAFMTALKEAPTLAASHDGLGVALAHLHQDDAARAQFQAFLNEDKEDPDLHPRAERYASNVNLVRAKMAPPFSITTLRGRHLSMDDLTGKVLLIDFWATWCGPCREALPHIRHIAQEFQNQPFVVLSASLDRDDAKWRQFVEKGRMTWLQYRDGPKGPLSRMFGVYEIPATFSIDADGVLEDQHVGDASIEGKLKKMIAHAAALQKQKTEPAAAGTPLTAKPGGLD